MYKELTEKQTWILGGCGMSDPVPLKELDVSIPFVYDRVYGAFYVNGGYHPCAMSQLLAFHLGVRDGIDAESKLNSEGIDVDYSHGTSDYYLLNYVGTCYSSSVGGGVITCGRKGNLSYSELKFFGDVVYLNEGYVNE